MTYTQFDTHASIKALQGCGFNEAQAEGVVRILQSARETDLNAIATKGDLRELESRLTIKLGTAVFALAGFLTAIKYLQ